MEDTGNRRLLMQLEICGHFLHHRGGGGHGQARILRILRERGQLAQKQLQEMLGIQSGSMSELVGKLEGAGLILRERCERDRRQVLLRISEAGERFIGERERQRREEDKRLFLALSPQEQQELSALLERLITAWRTEYDRALFDHPCAKHLEKNEKEEGPCSNT